MLKRLIKDEGGQDLIEYGVLAAFLAVAALATIKLIGPIVNDLYVVVTEALESYDG